MSSMGAKNLQFAICSFYARKKLSWRRRKFLLRAISHSVISWTPLCASYATKWVREPIWVQKLFQTQYSSDEFELKFPELTRAELGRLRAEPGLGTSIFELKPGWQMYIKYNQISQFCSCNMILINFMIIYLNLCSTKGVLRVE